MLVVTTNDDDWKEEDGERGTGHLGRDALIDGSLRAPFEFLLTWLRLAAALMYRCPQAPARPTHAKARMQRCRQLVTPAVKDSGQRQDEGAF